MLGTDGTAVGSGSRSEWFERVSALFSDLRTSGKSSEEIFVQMFDELKQLARMKIARRSVGDSMHATRLLSDLWVRLFANRNEELTWESAGHFVAYVTKAMGNLLIDYWRQYRSRAGNRSESLERGLEAGLQIADRLDGGWSVLTPERVEQAVFIDQLLERIERDQGQGEKAAIIQRQANIVRLRLFAGCTEEETASLLGCSSETVTKEFRKARAKLARYAQDSTGRSEPGQSS
jgi:RNA polymerase sigma-70 factor (ECF subfamily)